jgi:hypothetical protein
MRIILQILVVMFFSTTINAQVGIGTQVPKATLDVVGANTSTSIDGIIIPRVTREKAISMVGDTATTLVENSTLIYVDDITGYVNTDTGVASLVDATGFYFYKKSSLKWMKLPDYDQVSNIVTSNSFWAPQATTSTQGKSVVSAQKSTAENSKVLKDIYQRGKVGIGYNDALDIDFASNPTQKQLEVGGDFRTVYVVNDSTNTPKRYLGFETNSTYLPSNWASGPASGASQLSSFKAKMSKSSQSNFSLPALSQKSTAAQTTTIGNLMYSSKQKDIGLLTDFEKDFEGNLLIQDDSNVGFVARSGFNSTLKINQFFVNENSTSFISSDNSGGGSLNYILFSKKGLDFAKIDFPETSVISTQTLELNNKEFAISSSFFDYNKLEGFSGKFGMDMSDGKFFIGDYSHLGGFLETGYKFPLEKGIKGQILKLANENGELNWKDDLAPGQNKQILITEEKSTITGGVEAKINEMVWKNPIDVFTSPKFFYMPSIILPINGANSNYVTYNSTNQTYSVDLYQAFKAQFDTPIKSSNGTATGLQGFVLSREAYEYHIIYADNTVFPHTDINFSNEVGQEGKFTYKVNPATIVNGAAFMNIVLKVK